MNVDLIHLDFEFEFSATVVVYVAVHCAQRKESQEIVPTGGEELVR